MTYTATIRAFSWIPCGVKALRAFQRTSMATYRQMSAQNSSPSATNKATKVPQTPKSFGNEFDMVLPEGEMFYLEEKYAHPFDKYIRFEEKEHEYFYEEKKVQFSVTQIVERFSEKFDQDVALVKMKKSARWPRPEYATKSGQPWTDEQIKQFWELGGMYARNRGTWMHYNIERIFNNLDPSKDFPEYELFKKFYNDIIVADKITAHRTEWRICDPDHNLAGSVDFVGRLPDGTFVIMDWKRSKKITKAGPGNSYGKNLKPPLDHVDDTEASKYFLQLNIYRYIIQKRYGIKISRMLLASFHPSFAEYAILDAPIWDKEVLSALSE